MKFVTLPDGWSGRARIVSEVANPESWFTADEMAIVQAFARAKRRTEWMLSRIAEKELRRLGVHGDHVSFSHSGPYGAAAIDVQPVGIDVEVVREVSESAARHYLSDEEIATALRCPIPNALLHFWSAKEALWKQRGGSVPTLKKVSLFFETATPTGLRFKGVETFSMDDLIAALTLPTV